VGCGSDSGDAAPTDSQGATDTVEDGGRQVFVGTVNGTNALAAMVSENGKVSMYVCGHGDTLESHTRWFNGDSNGQGFILDTGGWKSEGTFTAETATGTLTDPEGNSTDWAMNWAAKDNVSGLYSALHSDCRTGVVVIDAGTAKEPTVQGAWCNAEGLIKQVTPMTPVDLAPEGLEMSVELDTGPESFFVQPHHPPI